MSRLLLLLALLFPGAALAQGSSTMCNTIDPTYFGCLAPAGGITRNNVVPLAVGDNARNASVGQMLGQLQPSDVAAAFPSSGHFYTDQGAAIARVGDRLFVGAAADQQGYADRDRTPRDWLSTTMAATPVGNWMMWGATGASLSRYGTIGWLAGSRTSDARAATSMLGYTPSSIGVVGIAIDDDTSASRTTTAYGGYFEVWKQPGVTGQPGFGIEIEAIDRGGGSVGLTTAYRSNVGGGLVDLQLGCGGGHSSGTYDCAAAIVFVRNLSRFQRGLVFSNDSLVGTDGSASDGGFATAIEMARNQALVWDTPETVSGVRGANFGLFVRSTVTAGANATRWEAQDTGFVVSNAAGNALFVVPTLASPDAYIVLQGSNGAAPGVYTGGTGSPNLGLYPRSGGEIQTAGPVCNAGGSTPGSAGGGFLHMSVNGTDYRIPLFTSAQTGC